MTETVTGNLSPLPVTSAAREHKLGAEIRVPARMSADKFERIERACFVCGMMRVTVLGRRNPREWKTSDGKLRRGPTPVCRVLK